ncbi:hypothetical protein AAT19DRAFT_10271 [Rhodotorula toruloides]|uniref:Sfi1 spindle body domain-containing protein n=1 Tax=Rhodotorula toruloides TaxID=5286 RepID=A0A2T0A0A9_RHOTO|nr:hypothetical protein AAT19DRAFT_10271 [Rhodotorula toruloides]
MAPHPGDDSQTQSSTLEPFPPLSSSQRNLINHTLALLAHDAHTWADLTHAQGVLQRDGHASADEIARLYEVWLRMVWVEGTTWHDKWDAVQRQWAEAEGVNGTNAATPVANRRNHRRRPSDNLDLLRRKLDAVELDTPQQPSSAPRPLPPRTRPKSTPPRQLLVRPAQQAGGYSSSDDQFVGVPTPPTARATRLALPPRTERVPLSTTDDDAPGQTTRRRRLSSTTPHQVLTSTPRPSARPPSPPSPEPTPLHSRSDAHPLLNRRLSALRPRSPSPSPSPRPPSSSSSMLISSALSPPEALSLALSFDRLRLLMPLFAHWSARVRFVREREGELGRRREGWLRRCGWEQWVGRFKRIREGREKAEEWRNERDERRLSKAGRRRALGGAFAMWREKWITRVETRQAAEREEARREKEAALREARDAVLSLRYRGLAVRSLREWRIRCATKRVEKVVGAGLARRAVEKWVRRVGEVKHRAEVMEEIADEKWAESEEGRKREKWGWWVRRTALRVKEAELVGAKEDALRREGWEWWREMKQRRDHVCHLEQVASAHDARHLALQSLSTWRNRTARLAFLSSLASTHAHTLLTRRASSQLTHWRLSLRLRLALRIRADSLLSTSLSHWLDAYEHVQIELEGRADALIATRDARVGGVALEVWRSAVAHRRKLQRAAETYARLRSVARGLEKWKRRWEEERVREKKAEVVRDFFVTRRAWRRSTGGGNGRRRRSTTGSFSYGNDDETASSSRSYSASKLSAFSPLQWSSGSLLSSCAGRKRSKRETGGITSSSAMASDDGHSRRSRRKNGSCARPRSEPSSSKNSATAFFTPGCPHLDAPPRYANGSSASTPRDEARRSKLPSTAGANALSNAPKSRSSDAELSGKDKRHGSDGRAGQRPLRRSSTTIAFSPRMLFRLGKHGRRPQTLRGGLSRRTRALSSAEPFRSGRSRRARRRLCGRTAVACVSDLHQLPPHLRSPRQFAPLRLELPQIPHRHSPARLPVPLGPHRLRLHRRLRRAIVPRLRLTRGLSALRHLPHPPSPSARRHLRRLPLHPQHLAAASQPRSPSTSHPRRDNPTRRSENDDVRSSAFLARAQHRRVVRRCLRVACRASTTIRTRKTRRVLAGKASRPGARAARTCEDGTRLCGLG